MFLLLCLCLNLNVAGEVKHLTRLPAGFCLSPHLTDVVVCEIPPHGFCVRDFAHIHGPEAAVAGGVGEKFRRVGSSKEHTAAGQLFDVSAISSAVAVSPEGQKLFDTGNIGFPESVQLRYFHKPNALQQLRSILTLKGTDTVVKPTEAHFVQQRRLTDTLRACEDQHIIILASGGHSAGDCGGKALAAHGAIVGSVGSTEEINKQRVQTGRTVPL